MSTAGEQDDDWNRAQRMQVTKAACRHDDDYGDGRSDDSSEAAS